MSLKEWVRAKVGKDKKWKPTYIKENPTVAARVRLNIKVGGAGYTRKPRRPYETDARRRLDRHNKKRRKMAQESRKRNRL